MVIPLEQDQEKVDQTQAEPEPTKSETETEATIRVEEFAIRGDALAAKVKELIHQGNLRRIIIKNEKGQILIEIPLTIGVVGGVISAAVFPVVAAAAAIGARVAHLSLVIEKRA